MYITKSLKPFTVQEPRMALAVSEGFSKHSPAWQAVMPYSTTQSMVLPHSLSALSARQILTSLGITACLVVDARQRVIGVVSQQILQSEQLLIRAHQLNQSADELDIEQVMQALPDVPCVDANELGRFRVENLVALLAECGSHYLLVVEPVTQAIRGLISATHISNVLDKPLEISRKASSFGEIMQAVPHPH